MFASQLRRILVGIAAVLSLVAGFSLAGPTPSDVTGSSPVVQTAVQAANPEAQAVIGGAAVYNRGGSRVLVRCSYNSKKTRTPYTATMPEQYTRGYISTLACPRDVDQFRSENDQRCMHYKGPRVADGWYKMKANTWYKISDLGKVEIYSYYYGSPDKCKNKPYFNKF